MAGLKRYKQLVLFMLAGKKTEGTDQSKKTSLAVCSAFNQIVRIFKCEAWCSPDVCLSVGFLFI